MRTSRFLQFSLVLLWILSAIRIVRGLSGDLGTFDGGLIGFTLLYVAGAGLIVRDATRADADVPVARVRGGRGGRRSGRRRADR